MKHIITLGFIFITFLGYTQKKYKRADGFFDKMWYIEAAKEYELAINEGDLSKEVLQKVGDAYYFNTNMEGASKWYDLLLSEYPEEQNSEYMFRYAHALQGIGDNRSAKKWMKKFSEKADYKDPRLQKYSQNDITLEDILGIKPEFELKNLSINTENSDFGPMYYGNKLVYSSAKDSSKYHTRKFHWNEQPFLNMYLGRINAIETDVTAIKEFSEELNTKYHEATLSFSPDQKTVYFTRNNYDGNLKRDNNGVNHLKLYSATVFEGKNGNTEWDNVKELPFNSQDYSVGHPAVSPDGSKLYFVSDMPGTIGSTDIFVVDILGDEEYSQPRNLGQEINTYGREMFPFVTQNKLYFASDGHLGLGGLDVFESDHELVFKTPVNLGAPLNSELDDFGFIVNEENNTGYVCSNRKLGKGDDDIYSFVRTPVKDCKQYVNGLVIDQKTNIPVANASVKLLNDAGEIISTEQTGEDGSFKFEGTYLCNKPYKVEAAKEKYSNTKKSFVTSNEEGDTSSIRLELEKKLNKLIVSKGGVLKINIGIIYFNLNKSFIRNDASVELNKVVLLMNEYPEMVIKIESHTDSRGGDTYNLKLSQRRADSTKEYIISQGIEANRIQSATGYGEKQIINRCKNDALCSNAEHDMNRRSEFIILKM